MAANTSTSLTTAQILVAGRATFTLEGKTKDGVSRRYTYRIDKVEDEKRPTVYFVKVLTGPDNDNHYSYLGMYDPAGGVRLTRASKFTATAIPVQLIQRFASVVAKGEESKMTEAGWTLRWSCACQRCGRTLTVPSSIDNRLGPDCAEQLGYVVKKPKVKKVKVVQPNTDMQADGPMPEVTYFLSDNPNADLTDFVAVRGNDGDIQYWTGVVAGKLVTVFNT